MEKMEYSNLSNVQFIRHKARDSCHALRLRKRTLAVDVRRQRLEEVVKKLKAPVGEEFTQLYLQLKRRKELHVLQKLRLGLGSSVENIALFLNCQGAMYSLVGCFTGQDGVLQREAACTLVNLALGNEKQCLELCQQVGIYLILYLGNCNPELQDPCAWCIGNLCGAHSEVCLLLASQGVEEVMLKALSSHIPHVIQSVAYALTHYLTTRSGRIRLVSKPQIVRRLVDALSLTEGLPEVGWCVFVLSTEQEVCQLLVDQGVIGTAFNLLEKLVNEQNLNVLAVTPVVRVLMNCAASVPGTALQTETVHFLANVLNAASCESVTGQCVVEDLSLRPRLEPALRRALAAHFTIHKQDSHLNFTGVF